MAEDNVGQIKETANLSIFQTLDQTKQILKWLLNLVE